ncbi:hypothetical protein [Vibrio mediterranei]|uniref:hypothetical protein n=1 Tax=Vibrio mediterranei TaxID=689 RepID=UPI0020A5DDEC|nr:hypothetical protein [Vibrio mediterranei]
MTGPEQLSVLPKNVYEFDCDYFNQRFDYPVGHSYFLANSEGEVSLVVSQMVSAIKSGVVEGERSQALSVVESTS